MVQKLKMTADELISVIENFPQASEQITLVEVSPMRTVIKMTIDQQHLRPGETVSGPTMFLMADCAFYLATLAMVGPKLLSVTTNATINFLRRPSGRTLSAEATILKLGKKLSVGEVRLFTDEMGEACVAHATMTYAIPPDDVSASV
ncbi:MAG: PaaI family thioesterase [Bradymonadia bacterium]